MELFKLVGQFVINGSDAAKSDINSVGDAARQTSNAISQSNERTRSSNSSMGSSWGNLKSRVSEYKTQGMNTSSAWRKAVQDMKSDTENASGGMVGSFAKIGAAIATYLTVDAIKNFGLGCIQAAADAQAMESQFSQVFGDLESTASQSLTNIADTAGISENRMKGSYTKIAAFAKTTGMDTADALSLADRAMIAVADSAAFYDRSLEETTESLQSFLKGNYENDAALGLSCTETTRNAAANELYGKSFQDLSESQKQLTLLKMVEDANAASGALGQAARESDTWTNMTGNLKQAWTDFQAVIGSNVLPLAVNVVKGMVGVLESWTAKIPDLVNWCKEHENIVKLLGIAVATLAAAIGVYVISLNAATIASTIAAAATTAFGAVVAFITSPITLVVLAIGALVAAFMHLWDTNEGFRTAITEIWNEIKTTVAGFIDGIKERLNSLGITFESTGNVISTIWNGLCEFLAPVFEFAFQQVSNILTAVTNHILNVIDFFIAVFKGDWDGAWEAVKAIFTNIWDYISNTFSNYINAIKGIADVILGWFGSSWNQAWAAIKDFFTDLWEGISSTVSNVWNTIKNAVQVGLMFIAELISAAFQLITLPFRFIWENCKETIMAAWNAIKTAVSNALNAIKTTISNVWNAIVAVLSPVLNTIKSVVSTAWNAIKTAVSTVSNGIKSVVGSVWNGIKTAVSSAVNGVKSTVSSVFNSIKSTASSVWNSIKSAISTPINDAKDAVKSAIDKMKGFFNFSWELPKIKLPHFSISGKFSLDPPSIPKFSVSWYKKAYGSAMILSNPTIFGYSAASGKMLGGGDGNGNEVVSGESHLMHMIGEVVESKTAGQNERIIAVLTALLDAIVGGNQELLQALLAGQKIVLNEREVARTVRTYA